MSKTFQFGYMNVMDEKMEGQTRSNVNQLNDFKTIPALRKLLLAPEFRMHVNTIEARCGYYLFIMQMSKDLNNKLLAQLKNKKF